MHDAPTGEFSCTEPGGARHCINRSTMVHNYKVMPKLIISEAPSFLEKDMVGVPINTVLDWPIGTPAGLAAFVNPKVNAQLKRMLARRRVCLQGFPKCSHVSVLE
ncbi:hypothetical protein BDQ12DRAFT_682135 [Crucibulum laeve]|uniref:L-tryptophan decarboxylase PsiD-like domain-containing protein n=1 Tax=Crucibulum laeve TaxID=68775 RepID=A0A5C3M5H3_9AGAR|nr:hypothetical protein BDQ12DRAFT_682135 [Crucibulum laeve]